PGWRDTYPKLATWYARILKRQSFIRTAPD
ncbi:MAG: glutathione S-transferase, partial [Alphaproteobacteria bacterium]|nr:glutathione S-transferase [Alphaproteobacteria bacterium]